MVHSSIWKSAETEVFWGEIAPCDHVLQIYENEHSFISSLTGYVSSGIRLGECAIVIATKEHLGELVSRLKEEGFNVDQLINEDQFIGLDAAETLSRFMVDNWPDEKLFTETITSVINRGTCKQRKVRAFGEMVALLWAEGHNGATVQLELLWEKFCSQNELGLFCAYPKSGFTTDITESIEQICHCHGKVIQNIDNTDHVIVYTESRNTA
jgi:hypothetical protein